MARRTNLRERLDKTSKGTTGPGGADDHTHELYADGTTSRSHGHTHTWKKGDKRTSKDKGHTHSI